MRSILLSLADYPDPEWYEFIRKNRSEHCGLDGGYFVESNPSTKPLYWTRVHMVLEALKTHDRVVWLDADAVLLRPLVESMLPERLAFAHDAGGINDGLTVTTKADIGLWELMLLPDVQKYCLDRGLHTNGYFRHVNPIHENLPMDVWNNRWLSEWTLSFAVVFHALLYPDRLSAMKKAVKGELI